MDRRPSAQLKSSGLVLAAFVVLGTSAVAAALPGGLTSDADGLRSATGLPLYTYDNDTMVGMSHCFAECAKDWPPLIAPAKAKASGDWSLVMREDGSRQWTFKLKPLYTCARDLPGKPAACADIPGFRRAK